MTDGINNNYFKGLSYYSYYTNPQDISFSISMGIYRTLQVCGFSCIFCCCNTLLLFSLHIYLYSEPNITEGAPSNKFLWFHIVELSCQEKNVLFASSIVTHTCNFFSDKQRINHIINENHNNNNNTSPM